MAICSGPCLEHCYKKTHEISVKYLYLIIGIIIGIILCYVYQKYIMV